MIHQLMLSGYPPFITKYVSVDKHTPSVVVNRTAYSTATPSAGEKRKLERVRRQEESDEQLIAWRQRSKLLRLKLHQK